MERYHELQNEFQIKVSRSPALFCDVWPPGRSAGAHWSTEHMAGPTAPLGRQELGKQRQGAGFGVAPEHRHCTERGKDQECERRHRRAPRQLQWTQVGGQMPGLAGAEEMLLGTPDAARHKARPPWPCPQRKQTYFHVFWAHYSQGLYLHLWLSSYAHPQK